MVVRGARRGATGVTGPEPQDTSDGQRRRRPAVAFTHGSSPLLSILGITAGAAGMLLILATVVGFLGHHWWVFELVSNLRIQLALGLVVVTVTLLVVRRWIPAALAGVAASVNLALVVPLLMAGGPAVPAAGSDPLQITFFNTTHQANRTQVIEYLRDREEDIVVLAAVDRFWPEVVEGSGLGLEVVVGPHVDDRLQILVLAREPDAAQVTVHRQSDAEQGHAVEITLELDGQHLDILSVHAISPRTPQRAQQRDRALDWTATWANSRDGPTVVIGDLNVTPWSPRYRSLLDGTDLIDPQRDHGVRASWPAQLGWFGLPLDHVLYSPDLVTVERDLGPSFGSYHRMLHAEVARREPRS